MLDEATDKSDNEITNPNATKQSEVEESEVKDDVKSEHIKFNNLTGPWPLSRPWAFFMCADIFGIKYKTVYTSAELNLVIFEHKYSK